MLTNYSTRFVLAAFAGVFFGQTVLADRAAVEQTMRSMEKAALAGDIEGYLKNVATDDPIFLKEQQNWAKDFKLHVPTEFKLAIVEPKPKDETKPADGKKDEHKDDEDGVKPPVFDDTAGTATFEMRMDWTMAKITRSGKDVSRTISYPVMFARQKGSDGIERWVYKGEVWLTTESHPAVKTTPPPPSADGHPTTDLGETASPAVSEAPNRCRYFPGFQDVAERVVEVLPEVRAHVDEGFENKISHVQEVKVYPTMLHLQASIYLSYVDGLSGWNEPGESIKLLASNKTRKENLRILLGHEYGHVATFEYGPHASDMPWWVLEGVADLSAEYYVANPTTPSDGSRPRRGGRDAQSMVNGWAKAGEIAKWEDLTDFRSVKSENMSKVYKQGQHMVGYISERFGRTKRNTWLRAMAQGAKLDEATKSALGVSFGELDAAWWSTLPKPESQSDDAKPDESAK